MTSPLILPSHTLTHTRQTIYKPTRTSYSHCAYVLLILADVQHLLHFLPLLCYADCCSIVGWRLCRIGCRHHARTGRHCAMCGSSSPWYVLGTNMVMNAHTTNTCRGFLRRSRRRNGWWSGTHRARRRLSRGSTFPGRLGGRRWSLWASSRCCISWWRCRGS